jgi:hypothetical protein
MDFDINGIVDLSHYEKIGLIIHEKLIVYF